MKILIVDDEIETLNSLSKILKRRGSHDVDICEDGHAAVQMIINNAYDVVLLDFLLPDINGLTILEKTKPFVPETELIMVTAIDDTKNAVQAIKLGAFDYMIKPVNPEKLQLLIDRAYERKGLLYGVANKHVNTKIHPAFCNMITQSEKMIETIRYAEIMAKSGNPILITGESGTGKELMARAIHDSSQFAKGPFVAVNLASIPESLFESQFFGHKKGAFTGADNDFTGYFRQANNGTLFLDEVAEIPIHLQAKLLRVLEERAVLPIGETNKINLNIRILSATNMDIVDACKKGKFRLDLLYRLKSARVDLIPLRYRKEDIPLLVKYFIEKFNKKLKVRNSSISHRVVKALNSYDFPGNVRELVHIVEHALLLSQGNEITTEHLSLDLPDHFEIDTFVPTNLKINEQYYIQKVLKYTGDNKKEAADILGISLRQLQRKLAEIKNL